jgi:hypothetical protein
VWSIPLPGGKSQREVFGLWRIMHWKDEGGCIMSMGDQIHCVCHAGHFEVLTGNVIAGLPPNPLPKMNLLVKGGEILATGWNGPNYVKRISTYA